MEVFHTLPKGRSQDGIRFALATKAVERLKISVRIKQAIQRFDAFDTIFENINYHINDDPEYIKMSTYYGMYREIDKYAFQNNTNRRVYDTAFYIKHKTVNVSNMNRKLLDWLSSSKYFFKGTNPRTMDLKIMLQLCGIGAYKTFDVVYDVPYPDRPEVVELLKKNASNERAARHVAKAAVAYSPDSTISHEHVDMLFINHFLALHPLKITNNVFYQHHFHHVSDRYMMCHHVMHINSRLKLGGSCILLLNTHLRDNFYYELLTFLVARFDYAYLLNKTVDVIYSSHLVLRGFKGLTASDVSGLTKIIQAVQTLSPFDVALSHKDDIQLLQFVPLPGAKPVMIDSIFANIKPDPELTGAIRRFFDQLDSNMIDHAGYMYHYYEAYKHGYLSKTLFFNIKFMQLANSLNLVTLFETDVMADFVAKHGKRIQSYNNDLLSILDQNFYIEHKYVIHIDHTKMATLESKLDPPPQHMLFNMIRLINNHLYSYHIIVNSRTFLADLFEVLNYKQASRSYMAGDIKYAKLHDTIVDELSSPVTDLDIIFKRAMTHRRVFLYKPSDMNPFENKVFLVSKRPQQSSDFDEYIVKKQVERYNASLVKLQCKLVSCLYAQMAVKDMLESQSSSVLS